jgi:CBS-domain-containing membrane protein
MRSRRVKRLPVVDRNGHLRGIVSRVDTLAVFERPDREICDVLGLLSAIRRAGGVVAVRDRLGYPVA